MFEVTFWVNSRVESGLRIAKSNVRFRLEELFEQENIVVAYPQRDIHLDGALKIINS